MSEAITHMAVVDDCSRLVEVSPQICDAFKTAFADHLDIARLAGITRWGDRYNPDLLETYRDRWEREGQDSALARKLAFVLGWMSHRAADRQMKRVFRELDMDCTESPTDCSIYNDICILREVFCATSEDNRVPPFTPERINASQRGHLAGGAGIDAVEDLFQGLWQRMLLGMHTFIPDKDDIESWMDRVMDVHQSIRVDIRRYAEAWHSPDPDKVRRFITDPNFYSRDDALIQLVRRVQAGQSIDAAQIAPALEAAESGSLYARILARGYRYLHAASRYFEREIDRDELEPLMDIGLPEF